MSEVFNLTIVDQEDPITLNITEQQPITVAFYEVAVPDPRVAQARTDAEAAAASAEADRILAQEAKAEAEAIVAGISTTVAEEVTTQLATKTADDFAEGATNKYYTDTRVSDLVAGGTISIHGWGNQSVDGSFRITLDSGELKIQKRISGSWVTRDTIG